jgi:putative transposase
MIPRHEFKTLSKTYDSRRREGAMSRWTQFGAMAVAQLAGRTSLRDIEATVESQSHLQYHLGLGKVKKSTLGRANQELDAEFYRELFGKLYSRCQNRTPKHPFRFKAKLFSLDASLIDVSMKVFPNAEYNRMKAAYKLHIGLDHDGLIPAFAAVTLGKTGDQTQAKHMNFPKGSVVVFDKGYSDYGWHNSLTDKGIFWVTRIRGNAKYRVLERRKIDKKAGISSDQIIKYTSSRSQRKSLRSVRRVRYYDAETKRYYVFITNHFGWSASTITQIYKQRWQVELFFKWIKQNLKIKAFVGNTDNAVKTQVMVALCVHLILAYMKFVSGITQSLQQISRLIQTNLFAKRSLIELFNPPPDASGNTPQMSLAL